MSHYEGHTTQELVDLLALSETKGQASSSATKYITEGERLEQVEASLREKEAQDFPDPFQEEPGLGQVQVPFVEDTVGDIHFTAKAFQEGSPLDAFLGAAATVLPVSATALKGVFVPLLAAKKAGIVSGPETEDIIDLIGAGRLDEVAKKYPQVSHGVDDITRFEIPDQQFKLKGGKTGDLDVKGKIPKTPTPIGELFDHPQLFEAFPKLKDVKIYTGGRQRGDDGVQLALGSFYRPATNTIHLKEGAGADTVIHELQHAIQEVMGLPVGGNVSAIQNKMGKSKSAAEDFYFALIGEVEARDAQKRFRDAVIPGERMSATDLRLINKAQEEQIDTGIPRKLNPKFLKQDPDRPRSKETVAEAVYKLEVDKVKGDTDDVFAMFFNRKLP